ncbi:MAG: ABC transporter permease, partial [Gemmatimonadota bacterium]
GRSDRSDALTAALDRGRAVAGLEIPIGFSRDLAAGRGAAVQIVIDGTNSNTATVVQAHATRIVRRFGAAGAAAATTVIPATATDAAERSSAATSAASDDAAVASDAPFGVDLRTRAWYNPELASRVYNVPAVIAAILLLMSLLLTAFAVVRERELGTLDQLLVSPISADELMLGKILPVAGIALVDLALITAVAILWFGIPFRGDVVILLAAALVYILASLGAGLLISTVSRTQQEAFMVLFLVFMPALVLSGFLYPIETMPPAFRTLTLLNPVRHFLEIVRGVFLKGSGLIELWPQLATVTAMAGAVIALGIRRFRRTVG